VTPDLIEGNADGGSLTAGHYIGGLAAQSGRGRRGEDVLVGQTINASTRLPHIAIIRPHRPFAVNSATWSESDQSLAHCAMSPALTCN